MRASRLPVPRTTSEVRAALVRPMIAARTGESLLVAVSVSKFLGIGGTAPSGGLSRVIAGIGIGIGILVAWLWM